MPLVKGTSSVEDSRALSKALKQTKFPKHFSTKVQDWSKIERAVIVNWIEKQITSSLGFEDEIVSSTAVNLFLPSEENNNALTVDINPRTAQIDLAGFLGDDDAAKFASELWELLLDASQQPTGIPRKILDAKMKEYLVQQEQQKLLDQEKEKKRQAHRNDGNQFGALSSSGKRNRWGDRMGHDNKEHQNENQMRESNSNHRNANLDQNANGKSERRWGERRVDINSDHRRGGHRVHINSDHQQGEQRVDIHSDHRRGDRRVLNNSHRPGGEQNTGNISDHIREDRNRCRDSECRWTEQGVEKDTQTRLGDLNKDKKINIDPNSAGNQLSNNNDFSVGTQESRIHSDRRGNVITYQIDRPSHGLEEYQYDSFGRRIRLPQEEAGALNKFPQHGHRRGESANMRRHDRNHAERFDKNHRNFANRDRAHYQNQYRPYDDRGQDWYRNRPGPPPRRDEITSREGHSSLSVNRDRPNKRDTSRSRSRSRSYSSRSSSRSRSSSSASSRGSRRRGRGRSRSQSSSSSVTSRTSASSTSSFSTRGSNA
jgi:PWI domain